MEREGKVYGKGGYWPISCAYLPAKSIFFAYKRFSEPWLTGFALKYHGY